MPLRWAPVGVRGQFGCEDLQRDLAVQLGVTGEEDLTHAASADLGQDLVVIQGFSNHSTVPSSAKLPS